MAATQIICMVAILASIMTLTQSSHDHHHHHHTKHVIHAPLHIKLIHHHKIIKVPVVMRKHLHHHKYVSHDHVYIPLKEKPKPVYLDESEHHDDGHHPAKVIIIKKAPIPVKYEVAEDSEDGNSSQGGIGGYESRGHYRTQIAGSGTAHGNDRNEDYENYEYEESRENSGYGNRLYH